MNKLYNTQKNLASDLAKFFKKVSILINGKVEVCFNSYGIPKLRCDFILYEV